MNKEGLRNVALSARLAMGEGEYQSRSAAITSYFFSAFDLSFLKIIHTFLPAPEKREPDIWPLIERIRRDFPHIRLTVPKVNGDVLQNFFFEGIHQLRKGAFGIQEPAQGIPVESEQIDLVLVPVLIGDLYGNRLGYGKGFYDRFLAECRKDCLKIGVSLLDTESEMLPAEPHDVRLNYLITPEGVINFN
ncbi:MAG: 5-formyltetrahydrofolate cyclo-ligase [Bacteroidetes bacterium]|nr:5-formyltetrahydrofolate cyclo-ligase [Bacteroidota bacterium]